MLPDPRLGLSCPQGGEFYVCKDAKTKFVGCCDTDPCESGTGICDPTHIKPAAFDAEAASLILPQSCDGQSHNFKTGLWYSCSATNPTFLGCCSLNPCHENGCGTNDLVAAALSGNATHAAPFLGPVPDSITTEGPSATPTTSIEQTSSTSTATQETGTPTATQGTDDDSGTRGNSRRDILVAVPTTAVILLAIALFLYIRILRQRKKSKDQERARNIPLEPPTTPQGVLKTVPYIPSSPSSPTPISMPVPPTTQSVPRTSWPLPVYMPSTSPRREQPVPPVRNQAFQRPVSQSSSVYSEDFGNLEEGQSVLERQLSRASSRYMKPRNAPTPVASPTTSPSRSPESNRNTDKHRDQWLINDMFGNKRDTG
ncbi:hypothetical protein F5Y18DRAFT_435134 [Xylariaceae sp. FL1019]|nr:hypothetical protein F5Y18DRAFT_435134 [Xylariaceae sp. FL1019]